MNAFIRDSRLGLLWLAARLWVGWQFLHAGYEKTWGSESGQWWGSTSGIHGFLANAGSAKSTSGAFPSVAHWYGALDNNVFLHLQHFFAIAIPAGEMLVGIGLILGMFTLAAAFFGALLNFNFLLSGSTGGGLNPMMLVLGLMILAAGAAAYTYGVDRVLLPLCKNAFARTQHPTLRRTAPLAH